MTTHNATLLVKDVLLFTTRRQKVTVNAVVEEKYNTVIYFEFYTEEHSMKALSVCGGRRVRGRVAFKSV